MQNRFRFALIVALIIGSGMIHASAQETEPVTIAVFPLKNLTGEVAYDDMSWEFADSLVKYLGVQAGAGTTFQLVPIDDVRDQMLAQNVDVKSPSYETDVWELAKLLGASKIVWTTYYVKYDDVMIESKVYDMQTMMHDPTNYVKRAKSTYPQNLTLVSSVADKILPGLH